MSFYLHICDKMSLHFTKLLSRPINISSNLTAIFNICIKIYLAIHEVSLFEKKMNKKFLGD